MKKFSLFFAVLALIAGGLVVSCKKKECAPCKPMCHPSKPQPAKQPPAEPSSPCRRY